MHSGHRIAGLILCALLSIAGSVARADLAQDWYSGAAPTPFFTTGGAMPAQQLKFGHPAPPASLMTPQWQALLRRIDTVSGHKLQFKEYGAGTLIGNGIDA